MKLGKRTWENSIRKFMDAAVCGGPGNGTSAPLPELEGRGGCLLGFLSSSSGVGVAL